MVRRSQPAAVKRSSRSTAALPSLVVGAPGEAVRPPCRDASMSFTPGVCSSGALRPRVVADPVSLRVSIGATYSYVDVRGGSGSATDDARSEGRDGRRVDSGPASPWAPVGGPPDRSTLVSAPG